MAKKRSKKMTKKKPQAKKKAGKRKSRKPAKAKKPAIAKSSADHRTHPRVPIRIKIDYFKDPGVFLYDYSRNLGRGGIFIETQNPMPPGTELNLHFALPEPLHASVEVKGKVVWVHQEKKGKSLRGVPGMGIQFINPEGQHKEALDRFFREIDYDNLKF